MKTTYLVLGRTYSDGQQIAEKRAMLNFHHARHEAKRWQRLMRKQLKKHATFGWAIIEQ